MDATLGATYIGVVVSAVLFGVSCSQVFYYFRHYNDKDGPGTKAIVIAATVTDTVHQAIMIHAFYFYLITNYNKPSVLNDLAWNLKFGVLFNGTTAFIVQSFFAFRIWKFSQKNLPITAILAISIVGGYVSSFVYFVKTLPMTLLLELGYLKALSMVVNIMGAVADVLITVAFCVLLRRAETKVQRSNTMVNLLIMFSIQTGMVTSLCAIASLITILVFPHTYIYMFFYFSLGRLYCNSLLATLNARKAIRVRGHADLGMYLRPIGDDSYDSHTNNLKGVDIKTESVGYISAPASLTLNVTSNPGLHCV